MTDHFAAIVVFAVIAFLGGLASFKAFQASDSINRSVLERNKYTSTEAQQAQKIYNNRRVIATLVVLVIALCLYCLVYYR